ncbi:tRNA (adenosine(37)-N6)-dimethylallyltransferase MiaA [Patescibacteria group bacterium]|nr:tRNA (adenosine(37)-N6)-dimethylallyltransferase MiaA [Patescibacteria group bacterium]
MRPQRVIAIVGPTAVGKSAFGVRLALAQNGEIVSADSRQVYRGLDIGSGKITADEMRGVPHHLLDIADPTDIYTAYDCVRDGRAAILDIESRGRVPIVVGGSGLYIDALLGRVHLDHGAPDPELRARLALLSLPELLAELEERDPRAFQAVDHKNPRRVMRALERVGMHTPTEPPPYEVTWIGLTLPREVLLDRIRVRLQERLAHGMLEEARTLHEKGLSYERMESLGLEYRFLARYLSGALSYDAMSHELMREIGKFARRQMTWFKRNKEISWFDAQTVTPQEVLASASSSSESR